MLLTYVPQLVKEWNASIVFAFCLAISTSIYSQTTQIPDVNFEQALIDLNIDSNGLNGNILNSDANTIIALNLFNKGINNLTGIEAFTSIKYLYCLQNQLEIIDISQNLDLEVLDIEGNLVSEIDISQNSALRELYISSNLLDELDVTTNLNLEVLSCNVNNLSELNVDNNISLTGLWCYGNNLNALNINSNIHLETLFCSNNNLPILDVSQNIDLVSLSCENNQLNALELESNIALSYLGCSANNLSALDISSNIFLERILCNNNSIAALDTSNAPDIFLLYMQNNNIENLNLSNNSNLRFFRAEYNDLTSIDLRNNQNEMITTFNVTENPNLTCIYVDDATASCLDNWDIEAHTNFVEDEDECNALSTEDFVLESDIVMFPNPATDTVNIVCSIDKIAFKLYTMSGQLIVENTLHFGKNTISLPNLSSGMYLVALNDGSSTMTKKLVIR